VLELRKLFKKRKDRLQFIGVVLLPLLLFLALDESFPQDFKAFMSWSESLDRHGAQVYKKIDCNYPIGGMLLSAGVISLERNFLGVSSPKDLRRGFQFFLFSADILMIFLTAALIAFLAIPNHFAWATLIYLLPSSWVPSSLWLQIEGFTQICILVTLLGFGSSIRQNLSGRRKLGWGYAVGLLGLVLGLWTKQLFLFSLPVLLLLWAIASWQLFQGKTTPRSRIVGVNAAFGVLLFLPDLLFLSVPDGYFSHLLYVVFGGGSEHGDKISGNGVNIWTFLGRRRYSSSEAAFHGIFTPKATGWVLYIGVLVILLVSFLRRTKGELLKRSKVLIRSTDAGQRSLALSVLLLGIINILFNAVLAGTHQRYLFHSYPFLIIGVLFWIRISKVFSTKHIVYLGLCASAWGGYVYQHVNQDHLSLVFFVKHVQFIAALNLFMLVYFLDKWFFGMRSLAKR